MTSHEDRAAAIVDLLSQLSQAPATEVIGAAITCSNELVDAGEPGLALHLLGRTEASAGLSEAARASLGAARVRALRAAGEHKSALAAAERYLDDLGSPNGPQTELWPLRVQAAGCLWQLNRVDEAVESLVSVRAGLIGRGDSPTLALCMHELASAEIFRGRLE